MTNYIATSELKSGCRVSLRRGIRATLADNAIGDSRAATIEGVQVRIAAKDIVLAHLGAFWVPVKHQQQGE